LLPLLLLLLLLLRRPRWTDPRHNLLAQVSGSKAVVLFDHAHSASLYPVAAGLCTNTSQVDAARPDLARFPRFASAPGWQGELRAGEMLYIPPLWWHYVASLTTSFSVSFWWGRKFDMTNPPRPAEGFASPGEAAEAATAASAGDHSGAAARPRRAAMALPPPRNSLSQSSAP